MLCLQLIAMSAPVAKSVGTSLKDAIKQFETVKECVASEAEKVRPPVPASGVAHALSSPARRVLTAL